MTGGDKRKRERRQGNESGARGPTGVSVQKHDERNRTEQIMPYHDERNQPGEII